MLTSMPGIVREVAHRMQEKNRESDHARCQPPAILDCPTKPVFTAASDTKEQTMSFSHAPRRRQFDERELSQLTLAIAIINAWNRISISTRAVPGSMDKQMGLDKAGLT
jgi:alkylhydroperoxidase family enzyme